MSEDAFVIRRVLEPHSVSTRRPFPASSVEALDDAATASDSDSYIVGRMSFDGRLSWQARGNRLEVINNETSTRVAAWKFCAELSGSVDVCVRAACEFRRERDVILAIAIQIGQASSEICVFDPTVSRVIKAISCEHVVTCLEPIAAFEKGVDVSRMLTKALQCFKGILAVGTETGRLFLIDLRLDDERETFTERLPSPLEVIRELDDVTQQRTKAEENRSHLCIELGGDYHSNGKFHFPLPDGQFKTIDHECVSVTAMKCIHNVGSIVVGFNFGSYQLWCLKDLQVISYAEEALMSPITHFVYQEPENDPRNFCYLWVGRGAVQSPLRSNDVGSLCLYHMMFFDKKEVKGYGFVYQKLQNVGPRFLYHLSTDPLSPDPHTARGSHIVSCGCIGESSFHDGFSSEDDGHETGAAHDRRGNLMYVVWENDDTANGPFCYFGLFDLDRWYHSQMPGGFKVGGNSPEKGCPFFTMYNLLSVLTACEPDQLIDVWVDPTSVSGFMHVGDNVPEEMLLPSAINLDAVCFAEASTVKVKVYGIQQRILNELNRLGSSVLLNPSDMFSYCWMSGLFPKSGDKKKWQDRVFQCESLLSVLLENGQLSFLTSCVKTLASADYGQSGFSLRYFLHWCVQKAHDVKEQSDNMCMCLFNGRCLVIYQQLEQRLRHFSAQFYHLRVLFEALSTHSAPTTHQGLKDLHDQLNAVTFVKQRFDTIMWLISVECLPELSEDHLPSENVFQYPYRKLTDLYGRLRQNLGDLNGLLIDHLVSEIDSNVVNRLWGTEFGGNGRYPPPSLYALLNVYNVQSASYILKLSIVYYLLLDLSELSGETDSEWTIADRFVTAFSLSKSVWRTVRGLWLLDHGDYKSAVCDLVHPSIVGTLFPSMPNAVVEALMNNGQHELAGQYLINMQQSVDGLDNIKCRMSILLANGLVADAFEYQHQFTDTDTSEELLKCFVDSCLKGKSMDKLLQLPFSPSEEAALEACLKSSGKPEHLELLVMHYLQRGRHVEAIRLNEKINESLGPRDGTLRNSIVTGYMKTLPLVQSAITRTNLGVPKYPDTIQYSKPTPLSVVIRPGRSDGKVLSQATMFAAVFEKIKEARSQMAESVTPSKCGKIGVEHSIHTPFSGTPLLAKNQVRTKPATPVVFPSETIANESMPLVSPSPFQPRQFGSPEAASRMRNLRERVLVSIIKTSDRISEPQSLLTTPALKSPSPIATSSSALAAPQSILKIRRTVADDAESETYTREKKQLSFNLSPDEDSVSPVSSYSSTPRQTRFSLTSSKVGQFARDTHRTQDNSIFSSQTSQEDSDAEVSFKIRTPIPQPSGKSMSWSSSSTTTATPVTQSDENTDGGRRSSQVKFVESTMEDLSGIQSGARGVNARPPSPPSPDERRKKLEELKQRAEKIMEGVRSSPPVRPSRGTESTETDMKVGAVSIPQDQDEDSFQSAVSDLQSPSETFADASCFTPPPSPRATASVTPPPLELEPTAKENAEQRYTSPHVTANRSFVVESSLPVASEPSVYVDSDLNKRPEVASSTSDPLQSAFQTVQSVLATSPFRSRRRGNISVSKHPQLSKERTVRSPYTFSKPTVLSSSSVATSQSADEEMNVGNEFALSQTPEFTFSPPLTRSASRRQSAERERESGGAVTPQMTEDSVVLPMEASMPATPLEQRKKEEGRRSPSTIVTPLRRSRRLQGASPHVPPSDTPLRLFPVDSQDTASNPRAKSTTSTRPRVETRQKRLLPSKRELGMRLRQRITRPKKTTLK